MLDSWLLETSTINEPFRRCKERELSWVASEPSTTNLMGRAYSSDVAGDGPCCGNASSPPDNQRQEPSLVTRQPNAEEKQFWETPEPGGTSAEQEQQIRTLLEPQERVQLWLDGRHAEIDNPDLMKRQGQAAVEWLVDALKLAYLSRELKDKLRQLLTCQRWATNLDAFRPQGQQQSAFQQLRAGLKGHLTSLGQQLERYFDQNELGSKLGEPAFRKVTKYHPLFRNRSQAVSQTTVMPEVARLFEYHAADRASKMYEERFLHCMLLVAIALNTGFQDKVAAVAAQFGMQQHDKTFQPAQVKGFARANNKRFADYRHFARPRTGYNVDVVRNLCVCVAERTVPFVKALLKAFGGAAKVKCLYSLPPSERADRFHLVSVMITVVYEPGLTNAQLLGTEEAAALIKAYCAEPKGVPAERWGEHTQQAVELLTTGEAGRAQTKILGEIQVVLPFFAKVRHQMHEPYKAWRSETAQQLYDDFVHSVGNVAIPAPETTLFNACYEGQLSVATLLLDRNADVNQADNDNRNPVYMASWQNKPEVVQLLLEHSADPSARATWGTPLDNTSNPAISKMLREAGATD